ncbi:MAG: phosphate acetyltransferase, partial [Bacteroidales bacterium]|nr:phosphate acetyltransferase [Bacteroidales bacterium]
MDLINRIRENAKGSNKRIVLPEATEERTLRAADVILEENLADLILLG